MEEPLLVVGRYAIYRRIASGGMATVHFGRLGGGAGFARTVAIKRLHPHLSEEPEFVSMMIDEARLVARVRHPNVVQTLDVVAAQHELLVVMEYVHGESLARLLRNEMLRQRRIPLPIVSAILGGALDGLHAAHEAKSDRGVPLGIVHRDVSPQNVLVGVDGVARVIDFGVAKAAGRLQTTREGVLKGKMAYMSPEQLSGQIATRLTDIYAAGIILWETLTLRRLFKADDDAQLLGKVLAGPSEAPSRYVPDLPEELVALTMRALHREPAARFPTARDMAAALVRIVPPALASDVGAWVEDVAHDAVAERANQLAEIETDSSASERFPNAPAKRSRKGKGDSEPPTTVSQPSRDSRGPSRAKPTGALSRVPPYAAWVVAAVSVVVALVLGFRRGGENARDGTLTPSSSTPVSQGSVAPPVASSESRPPASAPPAAEVTSAPSTPKAVASAEPAPAAVSRDPATPHRPQTSPKPGRPAAGGPRVDCNPPYTVDATGLRIPKPGCF